MTRRRPLHLTVIAALALFAGTGAPAAQPADPFFVVTQSTRSPEAVVAAIEVYAREKGWAHLGASRVNQNRITLVKVCAPEVARLLWPLGPHVAAMLPCGNLSVYQRDGRTEISLLHARYMAVLYPHEATRQAAEVGQALFLDMVRAVAGAPN